MEVPKKPEKLINWMDQKILTDTLHQKSVASVPCNSERCMGSMMSIQAHRPAESSRTKEALLQYARDFCDQFHESISKKDTPQHFKRLAQIHSEVKQSGTYELTYAELTFGAKQAWRNAPRCIGRIQWNKLQVFDARNILTARGMFEAMCNHVRYATNKGNLRSAITIFPQRKRGRPDFRVWNAQIIKYAGYKMGDGQIVGDPASVPFTEQCIQLGWVPKYGPFDILPLVVSAAGGSPEWFEFPPEIVLEVELRHPKYPWFAALGLRWYALPGVAGMLLDCGGIEFTACPFNGWYMGTEIGARDLCDSNRYNIMETVATRMGLDKSNISSLWKDQVLVETNIAVLYSFQTSGVTITDHHAASESFMKHMEKEHKLRGGCPSDWVWVVPPMSGSLLEVFHQEMLLYKLKPSFEYQEEAWKVHTMKSVAPKQKLGILPKGKISFKIVASVIKFTVLLMASALSRRVKCTILYATETGKSERYANMLCDTFKYAFDARVVCMEEYDVLSLEHESLVLIVASTFGNGDPPKNGEEFSQDLFEMKRITMPVIFAKNSLAGRRVSMVRGSVTVEKKQRDSIFSSGVLDDTGQLGNLRYSVFALGSKAYPRFAAFGHYIDNTLYELGAERIFPIGEGDELGGQEQSFRTWARELFQTACEHFCITEDLNVQSAMKMLAADKTWKSNKFRIVPLDSEPEPELCEALSKLHGKQILSCTLTERIQLQAAHSDQKTILVKLDTLGQESLQYYPGDHLAVCPTNPPELVDAIIARLTDAPPPDQVIKVQTLHEIPTPLGIRSSWNEIDTLPIGTLRSMFTYFLDITRTPSQALLNLLSKQPASDADKAKLENLAKDSNAYEDWKFLYSANVLEVLEQFPSLQVPPTLLLSQLPTLQQRYYSISSSNMMHGGEIHATIAVVSYRTQNGAGPVHEGVCSGWMNRCPIGVRVPCFIRTAFSFHMPANRALPIIMVGAGTGIAPFRSFWQQRKIDIELHEDTQAFGPMSLFFGCRASDKDNIYGRELEEMKLAGVMDYSLALSREPGVPKVYVQDMLLSKASMVYDALVKKYGHIYVCGNITMAHDVTCTVATILQQHGGMNLEEANEYIASLLDSSRYHEDIFGVNVRRVEQIKERPAEQSSLALAFLSSTKVKKSM